MSCRARKFRAGPLQYEYRVIFVLVLGVIYLLDNYMSCYGITNTRK